MKDTENPEQYAAQIRQAIFELAEPYSETPKSLSYDDSIPELGVLGSAGIMNLIAWYEENFGITVEPHEFTMANLGTINAMVEFLFSKSPN